MEKFRLMENRPQTTGAFKKSCRKSKQFDSMTVILMLKLHSTYAFFIRTYTHGKF